MYTLDKPAARRTLLKTAAVYAAAATLCVLFNNIYALFSHGVRAAAMTWMWLYPMAGAALYVLCALLLPQLLTAPKYRLCTRLWTAGLATLTVGALLRGILDIAGATSPYLLAYTVVGWACVGLAGLCTLFNLRKLC